MKMRNYGLLEEQVLDVFNHGTIEKQGGCNKAIKKYSIYEVKVYYIVDSKKYKILLV